MRIQSISRIAAAAIICVFLSGCWDRVEIENRGFVISLGIDVYDPDVKDSGDNVPPILPGGGKEPRFTLSMALPNAAAIAGGKSEGETKSVKKTSGRSLAEAIQLGDSLSSQSLYFGKTKICVLGEALLSDSILLRETLDTLERNQDISRKLIMLSCKGEAAGIIGAKIPGEPLVGLFVSDYYKNSAHTPVLLQYLENCTGDLLETGCTLIPRIEYSPDSGIRLSGAAVIKDWQLLGFIDDKTVQGLMLCKEEASGMRLTAEYDGESAIMNIYKNASRLDFFEENDTLAMDITLNIEGGISEYSPAYEGFLTDEKLERIRERCEELIKNEAEDAINLLQKEYNADCLHFSREINKHRPELYKKYAANWSGDIFAGMPVYVTVNVKIRDTGTVR